MYSGVYSAKKKDGTIYFRSSFTYKNKHISLGSFATEKEAHKAYLEANDIMNSKKKILITVQQVCAFTARTVKKHRFSRNKSITEGDFAWICARNYEGTE